MTLASHARGPEFEPRCEYFCFGVVVFFPLCFFFGGWGTKNADYAPHLEQIRTVPVSRPPTPKPPWHHNQTHNQSRRSCSLCSEEALGMIGTFITHCRETIKAVDLSHTSFFKTGWECPGVSAGASSSVGSCRRTYWIVVLSQKKILRTRQGGNTQQIRPKTLLGYSVWLVLAKIASQRPEVLQYRGHGPGARASPALDPWVRLKHHS